jgi:hypothetical protein
MSRKIRLTIYIDAPHLEFLEAESQRRSGARADRRPRTARYSALTREALELLQEYCAHSTFLRRKTVLARGPRVQTPNEAALNLAEDVAQREATERADAVRVDGRAVTARGMGPADVLRKNAAMQRTAEHNKEEVD